MTRFTLAFCAIAAVGVLLSPSPASAQTGTWYLALDAEPFGLPPGANLPGMATFHRDKTFLIEDGGDFGGLPFETQDSAQIGSWRKTGGGVEAVSLFLQGDALNGEVQGWQKVHLLLEFNGKGKLVGTVNVFTLACDEAMPFPVFGCPDPIESASEFEALPPFDVPVRLSRLRPRHILPD